MGFVDAVKDFVGFGDVDYEEDYEYEDEEIEEFEEKPSFFSRKNKVIPLDKQSNTPRIMVIKPKCFNNSTEAADQLKQRRPVILDVGGLDPEEARRVVDFIAGTVYGLGGDIQKVSGGIFVATPSSFDIAGDFLKDKSGIGLDWSMFK
ncbi:MAG: cell division protein SepF [Ruminococcaceae bacterium]|nr:cell division protein SepF [Oscillospiraceae bacterium]